jgi:hypothetical protein
MDTSTMTTGPNGEYNHLRREILNDANIVSQIFTVSVTASAILIAAGFQQQSWVLFLSTPILLIPSLGFISAKFQQDIKIASYLYVFHENFNGNGNKCEWERNYLQLRDYSQKKYKTDEPRYSPSLSFVQAYIALIFLSITIAWVGFFTWSTFFKDGLSSGLQQLYSNLPNTTGIVSIAVLLIFTIVIVSVTAVLANRIYYYLSVEFYKKSVSDWEKIKVSHVQAIKA